MTAISSAAITTAVLLAGGLAWWDLQTQARDTLVVYTTPALRDLLEKSIVPRFESESGIKVSLVFVPAGEQYNRLRMGGENQEADLFIHASPLYLEKAHASGYVDLLSLRSGALVPDELKARAEGAGESRAWFAFAWSPLVEVQRAGSGPVPDLATTNETFGFPHPILSNNGVYAVLLFEGTSREAGRNVLQHTRVQPTNARANIGGVADGSFHLTLGYEAVVDFFQAQGARVESELPLVNGERVTTPVLCSVALVRNGNTAQAQRLAEFLFTNETQADLANFGFRNVAEPTDGVQARVIHYDWEQWARLEAALSTYEVKR